MCEPSTLGIASLVIGTASSIAGGIAQAQRAQAVRQGFARRLSAAEASQVLPVVREEMRGQRHHVSRAGDAHEVKEMRR